MNSDSVCLWYAGFLVTDTMDLLVIVTNFIHITLLKHRVARRCKFYIDEKDAFQIVVFFPDFSGARVMFLFWIVLRHITGT